MKKLFSISLFFLFTLSLFTINAQSAKDTILASQYLKKSDSLLSATKFKESIPYSNQALDLYQKARIWQKVVRSYNHLSEAYWRLFELQKSLKASEKALMICDQYLSKNHKQRANTFLNLAQYYYRISEYQKSINYLEMALAIFQNPSLNDYKGIANAYNTLGNNYFDLSDYSKALEYHKKALQLKIKTLDKNDISIGISYNNMGNAQRGLGEFQESIKSYQSFLEIVLQNYDKDHLYAGFSYLNIGTSYIDLIQYDIALENYKKALPIFLKNNNKYGILKTYHGIGNVYSRTGQANKAIDFFTKSISIGLEVYGKESPEIAFNQMNIGKIYSNQENNKKAIFYYNEALSIFKKTYPDDHELIALLYDDIGHEIFSLKTPQKALEYHLKSLTIRNKIYDNTSVNIAKSYSNIADYYSKINTYDQSINYRKKALKQIIQSLGDHHPNTTYDYSKLGDQYNELGNYKLATRAYNNSLRANSKEKKHPDSIHILKPESFQNSNELLYTLKNKAEVLHKLYQDSENQNLLEKASDLYQYADQTIDYIRKSYQNYEDKISFAKDAKETYSKAIKTHLLLYDNNQNINALEKAYYYVEKSKSNTLRELINNNNAKEVLGLPTKILETEKKLRTESAFYQSQLAEEKSSTNSDTIKINEFENKLFNVIQSQDSLSSLLEKKYPKYYKLKHENTVISVSDIQQKLTKNNTILEYFTTDSITYAFTITRNNITVKELKVYELLNKIEKFRNAIISKNTIDFKKSSYTLFQELIAPIKKQLTGSELIIIPDGPLWHLNFDLLLTKDTSSNNPSVLPYLLNNYAISYGNSTNLLFNQFTNQQSPSELLKQCLAFSYTDSTTLNGKNMSLVTLRNNKADLPGTREEIKAISSIIDGQYYFGTAAKEANFKKFANQYNILHLALHGEVDNDRPENSKLYFTKSQDTLEDNLLYSHELFALNIPAELTVLSACNTGNGKIAKGEGIMSLGNAFQYAGTKSLLLTNWEVSDKTTPQVMKLFYTNLKKGMSKPKALQQAKLQFIATADIQNIAPFYWGGFYLVGDSSPIEFNSTLPWGWIIFGLLGVISFFLIFIYRRRKAKS